MRNRVLLFTALLGALACNAQKAQAMSLYAGLLGGYGTTPEKHPVLPYGVGLGANAGLTLPSIPIYVGARLLWFIGHTKPMVMEPSTNPTTGATTTVNVKLSESYLTYGVDLGYDAELGPLVLRPELGIGRATLNANTVGPSGVSVKKEANASSLYLSPAVELLFKPGLLYLGGELRYMGLTAHNQYDGIVVLAHLGLTI